MENNYVLNAQNVLGWINDKIQVLEDRNFNDDYNAAKVKKNSIQF